MNKNQKLLEHLDKLHTTELGIVRIKRNLSLNTDLVVEWCREEILAENTVITQKGKNWYADTGTCIITINAHSYTIITAHKKNS